MLSRRLIQLQVQRKLFSRKYFQNRKEFRLCSTLSNVNRDYGIKDEEAFHQAYSDVVKSFMDTIRHYDNTLLTGWMEKCINYNLRNGPLFRGQLVSLAYKRLAPEMLLDPQNIKIAQYIGWCVEMQEIAAILVDDLVDQVEARRGKPSWYKVDGVGDQSVNDTIVLKYMSFICLENLVGHKDYYCKVAQRLRDSSLDTFVGQTLDFLNARSCITSFTMEKYINVINHKVGDYGLYMPVALALDMCGCKDQVIYRDAFQVLSAIACHGQMRDDYHDCFGRQDQRGTDIEQNKITWLAVNAVKLANKNQLEILKSCYGQNDPDMMEKVRGVYKDLRLDVLQDEHEKKFYDEITQMINNSPHEALNLVYKDILDQIYTVIAPKVGELAPTVRLAPTIF